MAVILNKNWLRLNKLMLSSVIHSLNQGSQTWIDRRATLQKNIFRGPHFRGKKTLRVPQITMQAYDISFIWSKMIILLVFDRFTGHTNETGGPYAARVFETPAFDSSCILKLLCYWFKMTRLNENCSHLSLNYLGTNPTKLLYFL